FRAAAPRPLRGGAVPGAERAVQVEQFATRVLHAATAELEATALTVVIRDSPPMRFARSAIVSASSAVIFAALVSGLVLVAAVPARDTALPSLADHRIAEMTLPASVPVPLDWPLNMLGAPPVAAMAPIAKPPVPVARVAVGPESRDFFGSLTVESEPAGAAVFVNRELVGATPITLSELRAGSRAV